MAVIMLPDAQADLLSLQHYMLDQWGVAASSHHKLVYRRFGGDTLVYLVAGHRQDYPTLLAKRLLSR